MVVPEALNATWNEKANWPWFKSYLYLLSEENYMDITGSPQIAAVHSFSDCSDLQCC